MKSSKEILEYVRNLFRTQWARRKGYRVPDTNDVRLGNDAVELEGAVLYADLRGSTLLVRRYKDFFAANVYKSFLWAACEVIKNNGGEITAFDGDRVMAVFMGETKCSDAAKAGLQIHYVVTEINKQIGDVYGANTYSIDYAAGIDVSDLFVVRTGVRGANDLAWIGNAANIAAKLSEMSNGENKTFITERCLSRLNDASRYGGKNRECMWRDTGETIAGENIFASSWLWKF